LRIFFCIRSSETSTSTRRPLAAHPLRHVVQVAVVVAVHRDADDLDRRQPGREGAGVVLDQHADEALDRAELRRVDHHRLLPGAVGRLVLQPEALGLVEVVLDGRHLPGAADGVLGLDRHLGPVEGGAARVGHELQAGVDAGLAQHLGRGVPVLLRADELVRLGVVAGGQLEVEVGDPEVAQQAEDEVEQVADLGRAPARGDVGVRVVLGEAADAGQPWMTPDFS
jgi:hypothetical protein